VDGKDVVRERKEIMRMKFKTVGLSAVACILLIAFAVLEASAQMVVVDRPPSPALLGSGVIGGLFDDQPGSAVSPLTLVTLTETVTVGAVTVYTTNLNGPIPGIGYPVGGTSQAILNIFIGSTLPLGSNTLSGGPLGLASTTVSYVETANGIEITASGLNIVLPGGLTYLIGITPILNFATNGQEFFLDAGANGQTTFLNNPGGALFIPLFGTETINANILDLPTPYTGMAIRITAPSTVLKGDVNGDGLVNLLDVQPFVAAVASGTFIPEADCNCDGVVNLLDVAPFVAILSGG
jgi:hypothetical protein